MRVFRVYRRVLATLGGDVRIAVMLGVANLLVAGLSFLDPVLFGRVIGLLSASDRMAPDALWGQAASLIGIWLAVGASSIGTTMVTVLQAERMSHRNRLTVMNRYFTHVLSLPLSFHGDVHSGRLMKLMLGGSDALFGLWLTFFREQLGIYVAVVILLPLTMFLNWRLGLRGSGWPRGITRRWLGPRRMR